MQRLQHVFQRAALALALLTAGIGGGYGLYQPEMAKNNQACASAAHVATASGTRTYAVRADDTAAHAACSCANA